MGVRCLRKVRGRLIDILQLTRDEPVLTFTGGETVVREGERTGALFVLVEGGLEVQHQGHPIARFGDPGSIVGEMGLLLDIPATADVVAIGDTTVRRMDDARSCFADNPEFARHLATVLAQRLWQVTTYLTDLQEQYADRSDTLGLLPTVLGDLLGGARPDPDLGSDREPDSPY